jgi:hypothetical protein
MKNNTVYIAIMVHGSSEFDEKLVVNKETMKSFMTFRPSEVTIPEGVEYVQYISHAPLGTCNFSTSTSKKESLINLEKHISELEVLDGKQLSEKLIELDHEISPSIQDIVKSIEDVRKSIEDVHKSIEYYERRLNENKTLKPLLTFSIFRERKEEKIRAYDKKVEETKATIIAYNKKVEEMKWTIRELQATKHISKKRGIYSYIEYDKNSQNPENMILSKHFMRDDKLVNGEIYVIANEGGKLKPNFEQGIFNKISKSARINLSNVLNYLNKSGYTRIVIIDYSCNKGQSEGQKVPRDVLMGTRKNRYTSAVRSRSRDRSRSRSSNRSRSRSSNSSSGRDRTRRTRRTRTRRGRGRGRDSTSISRDISRSRE